MDLLESFVAGALLHRVRKGDRGGAAASASFRGAVLFVDISDYTGLAERLCSQGSDGVDQLGETLNLAFRRSLHSVYDTAGEIACFAGDAFLAYWPADDGNVSRVLRRAQRCARLLHAALPSAMPTSPTSTPTLHIGLSAGDLWAAHLGSDERSHLLLAGNPVREACAAAVDAAAGDTIVAPAAGALISGFQDEADDALDTGAESIASPPSAADRLALVPKRVQEYIGEGFGAWLPQRRSVCALFIRIDGLDDAAPDALMRHQAVVTSLHASLLPYTGSTGTLLLDDKGLVFTLCLGMPHDAHADDALRAVRAGLAVRTELERLGLNCGIGVATGPAVCMPLGAPPRQHYWAVGRPMHVAARLMQAANDGLLCTEEIADQVRWSVSLSPERPLVLRGLRWPLRPFRVREALVIDEPAGPLFGREDEQAALDRCADAFEAGRGTVLWITGEAGLGKTALAHDLRQRASLRQITCLSGGAGSVEIAVAYAAWRPVFAAFLEDPPSSAISSQAERLARLGAIRHPELASLVNAVVPGFLEETPIVRSLSGQARADATARVLSEIIASRAGSRFILVLEDCHWMDSASWRLLLRVAQDYPQALIVLTSRPLTESQELIALKRLEQFVEMKLPPLRSGAIESIVESVLGERPATEEVIKEITRRSVGNPLFAREYALLLTTPAAPRSVGLRPVVSPPPPDSRQVPVTVQGLIASRLDALPPSEDLALKAASVIGDRFDMEVMAGVYPGVARGSALETILANLAEKQLVVRTQVVGGSFAFQHTIIREVAYDQLTREQRRDLHRRMAETLERVHHTDLRPHFATLAHHWSRAEVPASTLKYSDQASSQALAAGAFEEADRLLVRCIELAANMGEAVSTAERIRWYRQLADARHGMGHLESRTAAAHQALRLAGHPRPHTRLALLVQAAARLCGVATRRVVPVTRSDEDSSRLLDIARAYQHSAEVCYFNNDLVGIICDSVNAVACASQLKPSAVLAVAATELGGILSIAGLRRIGEPILRRATAVAEAADDQAAQAHAYLVNCLYFVGRGDWPSAEASARRCQELYEPMDDRVNWTNAQAVRFWMSYHRGHDSAAVDAAHRLRDRASETGNRQHRAWALRCLALCALRREEPAEAAAHLEAALESLGETAALNERIPTLGILALAQLRSGQVWAARATARDAVAQVRRVARPIGHGILEGYSSLITVALHAWREERSPQWRRAVQECLGVLARYRRSFVIGEPRYQLHRGDFHRLSGSIGRAGRCYRRGEAAALRLGMPGDLTRCREALQQLARDS